MFIECRRLEQKMDGELSASAPHHIPHEGYAAVHETHAENTSGLL